MSDQHQPVQIRRLSPNDYPEWLRCRRALWDAPIEELQREMDEIAANPATMPVFVAERPDGKLCGLMEVTIHKSAPGCATDKIGYIEGWYVDEEWRQQGIGGKLVMAAEEWARENGCTEMASDTNSSYPLSPAAHAALGYKEVQRDIFFRKALD